MDLLSELLKSVRIAASAIGRFSLGAPFHLGVTQPTASSFVVLSGRIGWCRETGPVQWLGPGDAVIGLRDTRYALASDFDLPQVQIENAWDVCGLPVHSTPSEATAPIRFVWGGPGERSELLAISYTFDGKLQHPLFHSLPDDLVVPAVAQRQSTVVQAALSFLNAERESAEPGYTAMAAHLAETLFLGLLRAYALQRRDVRLGGLCVLHDARLLAAVSALHAAPARRWTVQALSDIAVMSRSALARRFVVHMGMPPLAYLTALRMHLARRRLREESISVQRLCEQLGYQSERAFRLAFQRSTGSSPREWRRLHDRDPRSS